MDSSMDINSVDNFDTAFKRRESLSYREKIVKNGFDKYNAEEVKAIVGKSLKDQYQKKLD